MKVITVNGVIASALLLVSGTSVAKSIEVVEGNYMVQCTAPWNDTTTDFRVLNVKRVEMHMSEYHYLKLTLDNGVVYHYLLDGESCGIQEQPVDPAPPASGGNIG